MLILQDYQMRFSCFLQPAQHTVCAGCIQAFIAKLFVNSLNFTRKIRFTSANLNAALLNIKNAIFKHQFDMEFYYKFKPMKSVESLENSILCTQPKNVNESNKIFAERYAMNHD